MSVGASATYVVARASAGVFSLLALSLFARALGPDGYAWLALASAGAALVVAPFLQPLQQSLGRFLPADNVTDVTPTLARLLGSLIGLTFFAALAVEFIASFSGGLAMAMWAIGSAGAVFDFAGRYATAAFMPVRYAAMFVVKAVVLLALAYAVFAISGEPWMAVGAICVSGLLAAMALGKPVWRAALSGGMSRQWLPRVSSYAVPLGMTMFVTALLQWADRFVLAGHVADTELGVYSATVDLAQQLLGLLGSSLYLAWFPRIVAEHEDTAAREHSVLTKNYLLFFLALMLPALVGVILLSRSLVAMFFGESYIADGAVVLSWVAGVVSLGLFRMYVLDIGLYLANRMRIQLRNVAIGAILGLGLNFLFVEQYGIWAAVFGTLTGQIVAALLTWQSSRDVIRWHLSMLDVMRIVICVALMASLLVLLNPADPIELLVSVCSGLAVYGGAMFLVDGAGCRSWLLQSWQHRLAGDRDK